MQDLIMDVIMNTISVSFLIGGVPLLVVGIMDKNPDFCLIGIMAVATGIVLVTASYQEYIREKKEKQNCP